jgi:2,3-bisphosphoglycerate-independent phosphoglycerate mutase
LPDFSGFDRQSSPELSSMATMTEYDPVFHLPAAFAPLTLVNILAEVCAGHQLRQLRIAETEKYAHVTYFFNGGLESPFPGEERRLIPSPQEVSTYDQKPEMSLFQVTDLLCDEWHQGYSLIVCNFANLDMVGHTGHFAAAVKACECVDACVERVVDVVLRGNGRLIITADHGNAEMMHDTAGHVHTAHSQNPVAFLIVDDMGQPVRLRSGGALGDIAPTILDLWSIAQPKEMTGQSLIVP